MKIRKCFEQTQTKAHQLEKGFLVNENSLTKTNNVICCINMF